MISTWRMLVAGSLLLSALPAVGQSERKLADWVKDLDTDHPLIREEALEMIATFGSDAKEAIPKIEALLKNPKPTLRLRSAAVLIKLGSKPEPLMPIAVEAARQCGTAERLRALELALLYGQPDEATAGLLAELVLDPDNRVRYQLQTRLSNFGVKAGPLLLRMASHANAEVVQWMLRSLERIPLDAAALAPRLTPLLKDRPPLIRALAVSVLLRARADVEPLLPAIKELLADKEYQARSSVLYAVGDAGIKHKELAGALEPLTKDTIPAMRVRAAAALWEIDGRTRETIPILVACMSSSTESGARIYAEQTIQKMGVASAELIPAFMGVIAQEPQNFTLIHHAQILSRLGEKAMEPLSKYFDDADPRVRDLAVQSLALIGEKAVPILLKEFAKATGPKRLTIIQGFVQMHSRAEDAVPTLAAALEKAEFEEQRAICGALRLMGGCAKAALPRLMTLFKDLRAAHPLRQTLLEVIGSMGPWAHSAVPILVGVLKDPSINLNERYAAAIALGHIGAAASEAVALLIEASKKDAGTYRARYLQAAFEIDPMNREVHQAIIDLCKDMQQRGQLATLAYQLPPYGEAASPILPALIAAQKGQLTPPIGFIQTLGQFGFADPDAVDYLTTTIDFQNSAISGQAALSLAMLGVFDEKNVDRLNQIIVNRSDSLRANVLKEINRHGVKAKALAPALLRAWRQEENIGYRMPLAEALAAADPTNAKSLVDWLKETTRRDEAYYAVAAAMALWRIDSSSDPLPVFRRIANGNAINRQLAIAAMGDLRSAGKDAVPDLKKLLSSSDMAMKAAAIVALLKIDMANVELVRPAVEELFKNREPLAMPQRQETARVVGELGKQAKLLLPALIEGFRRAELYERNVYLPAIRRIDADGLRIKGD